MDTGGQSQKEGSSGGTGRGQLRVEGRRQTDQGTKDVANKKWKGKKDSFSK